MKKSEIMKRKSENNFLQELSMFVNDEYNTIEGEQNFIPQNMDFESVEVKLEESIGKKKGRITSEDISLANKQESSNRNAFNADDDDGYDPLLHFEQENFVEIGAIKQDDPPPPKTRSSKLFKKRKPIAKYVKMEWTRRVLAKLIQMYRARPCLWLISNHGYKNKITKNSAYKEMVSFLKKNGFPDANVKFVKAKIQNLRRAVRKEMKKIKAHKKLGMPEYIPSLWYYDMLLFTLDQEEPGPDKDDGSDDEDDDDDDDDDYVLQDIKMQNEESDASVGSARAPSPPQSYERRSKSSYPSHNTRQAFKRSSKNQWTNKKKEKTDLDVAAFLKSCTKALNTTEKPDEYDTAGINFAAKLKKMTLIQQVLAESLIQKVITKGLLQKLTKNTDVIDTTTIVTNENKANDNTAYTGNYC